QPRLLELEEVDASLVVNQLVTGGDHWRGDLEHAQSVRMFASNVQLIYTQKIQVNKLSGHRAHLRRLFPVPVPPRSSNASRRHPCRLFPVPCISPERKRRTWSYPRPRCSSHPAPIPRNTPSPPAPRSCSTDTYR